jgi:hypothetical protein
MTISVIIVRAVAFGSCFVRRLILSTTDLFEPVTVYDQNDATLGYLEHNVVLPLRSENNADSQIQTLIPSETYYIQCKYQNVLSGCRPALHTYLI